MINTVLKQTILKIVYDENNEVQRGYNTKIAKIPELVSEINDNTSFLNTTNLSERLYYYLHNLNSIQLCDFCQLNSKKFISLKKGMTACCSKKCAIEQSKITTKNTNLKKYGVEYPSQTKEVQEKMKLTNLKKYGCENVFQAQEIKDKIEHANLDKYGVKHPMQTKEIQEKTQQTNLDKYGSKHPSQIKDIQYKIKETNLNKYGCENVFQAQEIKDKIEQTNLDKYGVKHPMQTKEIQEKTKQTNLDRYGCENVFQAQEIKDKIEQTNLDKYGVKSFTQTKEYIEKCKHTNLKNYHFEWHTQSETIKEKIKHTNLEKYGVESILEIPKIRKQIIETNLEKYGVEHHAQLNIVDYQNYNKEFIQTNFVSNHEVDIEKLMNHFNITQTTAYLILKRFDIQFFKTKNNTLRMQEKLYNYLKEITNNHLNYEYKFKYNTYDVLKTKDGKKLELDIIVEVYEKNTINDSFEKHIKTIAIEYNGLMFHSFGTSIHSIFDNANYETTLKRKHLEKTKLCEEQGIHLFQIQENEWLDTKKQHIWISMLNNALMLNTTKISARKCILKDISDKVYNKDIKLFLEENHIQGNCPYTYAFGLYFNNELVSLMTFGKSRYNKNYDYELLRFCSISNVNVIGAGSKLLAHFKNYYLNNNETLISYGNRRWTSSLHNFYKSNNFIEKEVSSINYYYFHPKNYLKLFHRSHFQKHKLEHYHNKNIYNIIFFDKNKSESENMYNNGFRKIYDCGQLVYILKNN